MTYWGNKEEEGPWIYKTKSRSLCCIQNIQKALICTQCNGVLQDTSQIISSTVQKEKNICGKKTKQKQECFIKIRLTYSYSYSEMIKNESLSCREVISDHKKGDVMNREIKYKHKILKGGVTK